MWCSEFGQMFKLNLILSIKLCSQKNRLTTKCNCQDPTIIFIWFWDAFGPLLITFQVLKITRNLTILLLVVFVTAECLATQNHQGWFKDGQWGKSNQLKILSKKFLIQILNQQFHQIQYQPYINSQITFSLQKMMRLKLVFGTKNSNNGQVTISMILY